MFSCTFLGSTVVKNDVPPITLNPGGKLSKNTFGPHVQIRKGFVQELTAVSHHLITLLNSSVLACTAHLSKQPFHLYLRTLSPSFLSGGVPFIIFADDCFNKFAIFSAFKFNSFRMFFFVAYLGSAFSKER